MASNLSGDNTGNNNTQSGEDFIVVEDLVKYFPVRGGILRKVVDWVQAVDKVSFTGGTETGKQLMRDASDNVTRLTLELGGKSPNIVFADCEMEAAIGYVQLKKLPEFLKRREENANTLHSKLQDVKALRLPTVQEGCRHSWYLFTVKLWNGNERSRDTIVKKLRKAGIGASVYYKVPIHLMPFYRRFCHRRLHHTEEAAQTVFSLPVHPAVSIKQVEYIADTVHQIMA